MRFADRFLGRFRRKPDSAALQRALALFLQAETWNASQRVLAEHPELLAREVDELLGRLIDTAIAREEDVAQRTFAEHRALLRRCREVGADAAFAEKLGGPEGERLIAIARLESFLQARTWGDSRQILLDHPDLLGDGADEMLAQLSDAAHEQGNESARHVLEEHRSLLARCRQVGVDAAFAEAGRPLDAAKWPK